MGESKKKQKVLRLVLWWHGCFLSLSATELKIYAGFCRCALTSEKMRFVRDRQRSKKKVLHTKPQPQPSPPPWGSREVDNGVATRDEKKEKDKKNSLMQVIQTLIVIKRFSQLSRCCGVSPWFVYPQSNGEVPSFKGCVLPRQVRTTTTTTTTTTFTASCRTNSFGSDAWVFIRLSRPYFRVQKERHTSPWSFFSRGCCFFIYPRIKGHRKSRTKMSFRAWGWGVPRENGSSC